METNVKDELCFFSEMYPAKIENGKAILHRWSVKMDSFQTLQKLSKFLYSIPRNISTCGKITVDPRSLDRI